MSTTLMIMIGVPLVAVVWLLVEGVRRGRVWCGSMRSVRATDRTERAEQMAARARVAEQEHRDRWGNPGAVIGHMFLQTAGQRREITGRREAAQASTTRWGETVKARAAAVDATHLLARAIVVVGMVTAVWVLASAAQVMLDGLLFFTIFPPVVALLAVVIVAAALSGGPVMIELGREHLARRARANEGSALLRRGLTVLGLAVLTGVVLFLITLAPKRADARFAGPLHDAEQRVTTAQVANQPQLVTAAQDDLSLVRSRRDREVEVSQAIIAVVGVLELGAGLVVPRAILLARWGIAARRVRAAKVAESAAVAEAAGFDAAFTARVSRDAEAVGVVPEVITTEIARLGHRLQTSNTPLPAALPEGTGDRAPGSTVAATPAPTVQPHQSPAPHPGTPGPGAVREPLTPTTAKPTGPPSVIFDEL